MSTVALSYDLTQLTQAGNRLLQLGELEQAELLENVGAEIASQTQARIQDDKTSSEGEAWAAWSSDYAAKRHDGHSLLQDDDNLLNSIAHLVVGNTGTIGSTEPYAATHQYGDTTRNIPARPYLGLSDGNIQDVQGLVDDFVASHTQRVVQ